MGILLHDIELPNETEGTMVIKIKPGAEKADIQWYAFVGGLSVDIDEGIDPVKHGKWENGYTLKMCSVCNATVPFDTEYDYCPHCGAQMERDGE